MRSPVFGQWAFCLIAIAAGHSLAHAATPTIDKTRLSAYIRYAEGFTDAVSLAVDDPIPSPFHDFYRVVVHLTAGKTNLGDKIYYVTPDGQQFVNGTVWNLNQSPFHDILTMLPVGLPAMGPSNAKVTVVIFSDFQCPYCRQLAQSIRQNIPTTFPKDVQVLFADFPLESKHPWARAAAEASHCLGDGHLEAFWAFHDWIFAHQGEIDNEGKNLRDKLMQFANEHHADTARFAACLDSHATAQEVTTAEQKAFLLGVQQTPTIFVDGRKVEGALPWPNLENLIRYELKRPADIPADAK
jgi:protein-disulfide isomerase